MMHDRHVKDWARTMRDQPSVAYVNGHLDYDYIIRWLTAQRIRLDHRLFD